MKITTFGVKVWRFMSTVFVIGALGWTYSLLPDQVAVNFDRSGLANDYISKHVIFYLATGLIVFTNVVIPAIARQVVKVPSERLPIPNKNLWILSRTELNEHLVNWLHSITAAINTIMAFSMLALGTVNSNQFKTDVFDFAWLLYASAVLLIVVIVALPVRLMRPPVPDTV
jgi:uncharacterized membrane protein